MSQTHHPGKSSLCCQEYKLIISVGRLLICIVLRIAQTAYNQWHFWWGCNFGSGPPFQKWPRGKRMLNLEMGKNPNPAKTNWNRTQVLARTKPNLNLGLPGVRFWGDLSGWKKFQLEPDTDIDIQIYTYVYRSRSSIFGSRTELGNRSRVSGFSTCRTGNPTRTRK